ncbi:hypothetical protein CONPUDRAFT_134237 [Coniophora puteana RWD-64-598 SS2]|uniref:F-box domain-containing protein n=1 Tax=Coniophora puteana (strain RWD-64-598) TaxID=741705 RepID=A0A5M3N7S6_CONPW|nr:uncharacterized protein CONPUDRAFT_134237 [Coniophora puteana RWD-64-598 SS2]EIW86895.1 hypothetical protein CONPUDRAFT_134237 [Coniophora puteana RWD-64-598 SS2]
MLSAIIQDQEVTRKLLESILDSPGGRKSLSRLARTCKAFCEPALDILWRELDSLLPLVALFPSNLMKRSRKPAMGFAKAPTKNDWVKVLSYGQRVRRVAYAEASKVMAPAIIDTLAEYKPVMYILPNLQELVWRVGTVAGLQRCKSFLNPALQSLTLEVGARLPYLAAFLADVCSRTQLVSFSLTSPTSLPDNFSDLLRSQHTLEKLVLIAPGALSSQVGQFAASLPALRSLELDLTGRYITAVEGFFDDIIYSGASTPSDASSDSGVFSADDSEFNFKEIRRSSLQLTGDLKHHGAFSKLRQLQLKGEAGNIGVFLRHLNSPLTHLELAIEDPPDRADWQDLAWEICERFGETLLSVRVLATAAARYNELMRVTSRGGEAVYRHLPLDHFTYLPSLVRFEIDLPESAIFYDRDLLAIAHAAPQIEILRLCSTARFPASMIPPLTLEGVGALTKHCRKLHTLGVVVDARVGSDKVFHDLEVSSRSLYRLHVGHSMITDPFPAAVLLSHIAPHLEILKFFHDKNRPGYVEANAVGWQKVTEWLPHLQRMRLLERRKVAEFLAKRPVKVHRSVDATVNKVMVEQGMQAQPSMVSKMIAAKPDLLDAFVDATPSKRSVEISAIPSIVHQSVGVSPKMTSVEIDATPAAVSKAIDLRGLP